MADFTEKILKLLQVYVWLSLNTAFNELFYDKLWDHPLLDSYHHYREFSHDDFHTLITLNAPLWVGRPTQPSIEGSI
jgi:hypothetical protein